MLIKNFSRRVDYGNSVLVHCGEDLIARYNWLKSSDRNGKMGALSATNRRTLVLVPGTITLSSTLTLDTDYVDIVSFSGNSKDTIVTKGTGGATVTQTANDVVLRGFTIRNTGSSSGDYGFLVDASDNSDSIYEEMHFRHPYAVGSHNGVHGSSDIKGTWRQCESDDYAWRLATTKTLGATMVNCVAGDSSYAGDAIDGTLSGAFIRCIGGDDSFGGCGGRGAKTTEDAYYEECVAGNNSYSIGYEFAGTAIRCVGGSNCFAGYSGTGPNYGTFSGYAEDCIVELGNNFGMGHTSCECSGIIINSRIGSIDRYAGGTLSSKTSNWTDAGAQASLTTDLTGDNNDLVYTAKYKGEDGNNITIEYSGVAKGSLSVSVTDFAIKVVYNTGSVPTASQVETAVEASSDAMALLELVANAPDNDGSGTITAMSPTNLSGGVNKPYFEGNHPCVPTHCDASGDIYPFDSGHTYTNQGAAGGITLDLPCAWVGLKFTFLVMAAQNLDINPQDTEQIVDGGVGKGNGKYARCSTVGASITLECLTDGQWEVTGKQGTWTYET